jgi:hypothetical protein
MPRRCFAPFAPRDRQIDSLTNQQLTTVPDHCTLYHCTLTTLNTAALPSPPGPYQPASQI